MKIFIAGIMQGSYWGAAMHEQGYRGQLVQLLAQHFPAAEIYDPLADHGESLGYGSDRANQVFRHHNQMCATVDLLVAIVPSASMGTAIEMWEAYRHGRFVVAISPLAHNWVIRFCSDLVVESLADLEQALVAGKLQTALGSHVSTPR